MRRFLNQAFTNPKSKTFHVVNDFLAILTIVSIISVVVETVAAFEKYAEIFLIIEWTAVVFFTLEYIGRTL